MKDIGQIFASGLWQVKTGKEKEFIEAWQQFATWTGATQKGVGEGRLLQDLEHPDRFLSFGPWENEDRIAEWRSRPEFTAFVKTARELCVDLQPRKLKVVAYSSPNS